MDPAPLPYAFAFGTLLLAAATYLVILLSALLERSGPIRLRHFAEEGGGQLRALVERPSAFEAFRFVLSFLAKVFPPCFAVALLVLSLRLGLGVAGAAAVALSTIFIGALIIELVIRTLVGRDPERALSRFTRFYRFALLLLWPALPLLALLMPRVPESVLGGRRRRRGFRRGDRRLHRCGGSARASSRRGGRDGAGRGRLRGDPRSRA